uniref:FAM21/CAPZIP domain-containing protein n=1 Tax=Crocodylus porosus TaxID=8502 RepID=A0A7M4DVW9_CROPO
VESTKKPSSSVKVAVDLFDDEGDLFKEKSGAVPASVSAPKEVESHKETVVEKKSQPTPTEVLKPSVETPPKKQRSLFSDEEDSEDLFSSSQMVKSLSTSKSTAKAPLSFFDDEDEEDLFSISGKKQQLKPPQEKAKQSEPLKKASSSLFSSDEEDHWNLTQQDKSVSEDQKRKSTKSSSTVDQAKAAKNTSLFAEDEEEDLFAITKDSRRKPQKASLLFEDDAVDGESLFSSQPPFLPSATKATLEPASPLGSVSNTDLLSASPPPLEKETKSRGKKALSLFEDEEEEKMEDEDISKNARTEPSEKSSRSKSTGVFQDEELLFSHKLQKDNDPDVDLFASPKKSKSASRSVKLSFGEGLFGDDEEDDLFSTAKAKPPKVAEKKPVTKKDSSGPSLETSNVPEHNLNAKQNKANKPEITEKSTGPAPIKTKEPSSRIGKLQATLAINPAALLPSAMPKISSMKPVPPTSETPVHEPDGIQSTETFHTAGSNEGSGVSFEHPMQAETLHSANKNRIKVTGKRRPPTRTARRLAAQESSENEKDNIIKEPQPWLPKQNSALLDAKEPLSGEPGSKESVEGGSAARKSLPADGSSLSPEMNRSPLAKPTGLGDDFFESDDLFEKSSMLKSAARPKAKEEAIESLVGRLIKSGEKPALSVLDDQGSDDLFQPIKQKSSQKSSPSSFLEDEDNLFTSQKTPKKKELKPGISQDLDTNIFEDDIFATEAIKPPSKTKEKVLEANLFDDNIDIFADLTVKPKEKKTKKKVESKSIFDDDMGKCLMTSSLAARSKYLLPKANHLLKQPLK